MHFGLLGPVEVRSDDHQLSLGGARQRAVLAALLLHPNQLVTPSSMVHLVWDTPPASAESNLRTYVAGLRRILDAESRLVTRSGGYQLTVAPEELDLLRFRALKTLGEQSLREGNSEAAADQLDRALALWRGEAFANISCTVSLQAEATRLEEERLTATECHAEARLNLGEGEELVAQLRSLVQEHPLRERLWAHLMVALYRCGRQADALAAYGDVRRKLAEELGIEPGPELRDLSERILRADPALDAPATAGPHAGMRAPSELPPAVADFTGRTEEVARLRAGLTESIEVPGAPAVWTITGPAGVGKTGLAVYVAHLVRDSYPDGQLYLSLRGACQDPVGPVVALGRLLRALGVPGDRIPDALDERMAMYRAQLADRRVLVVLDNASDAAQVRPLLPGTPGSSVLLTSRAALVGLENAQFVELEVLSSEDALELLSRSVGPARVAAEPTATKAIVDYCGRLPLALRVAGARLVARPHWRLTQLSERLSDERRRFTELSAGDLDVRASLALSYDGLDAEHRRAFRLLSLLDAGDFPAWVVAPLLDVGIEHAEDLVEVLADARLVEVGGRDATGATRFRLHDLLRAFGRDLAAGEDNLASLTRLLDTWLDLAVRANHRIPRQDMCADAGTRVSSPYADDLAARLHGDPITWFDVEWLNLRATVDQAAALGFDEHAWRLAAACAAFYDLRSRFDDWAHVHRIGLDCIRRSATGGSDAVRRAEAILLQQRGVLRCRQNRFEQAMSDFRLAQAGFEEVSDADGAAYAWHGIGWMHEWRGNPTEALDCHQRAIAGFADSGNDHGLVGVLCSLGAIARRAGDFDAAREHLDAALTLSRRLAEDTAEMFALLELGRAHHAQGDLQQANSLLALSLAIALRLGDADVASNVRLFLAEVYLRSGRESAAQSQIDQALSFFRELRDKAGQARAWRLLSQLSRARGNFTAALDHATRATVATADLDTPPEHARSRRELACVLWAVGRRSEAIRHWEEALASFDSGGFDVEAAEVRREAAQYQPLRQ